MTRACVRQVSEGLEPVEDGRVSSPSGLRRIDLGERTGLGEGHALHLEIHGCVAITAVDQSWTFALGDGGPNECGGPGSGIGTSCPNGNPNFGQATVYQSPRTLRLGAKLSWRGGRRILPGPATAP